MYELPLWLKNWTLEIAQETKSIIYGDFLLSSGISSKYYFDGRLLTLHPKASNLFGFALLPMLYAYDVDSVGGPTIGADPLIGAIVSESYDSEKPLTGFIVRKGEKKYGMHHMVEGYLGKDVAIIDDVCTSGKSILQSIDIVEELGCNVKLVFCILNRMEGGDLEIKKRGYPFYSLLSSNENSIRTS